MSCPDWPALARAGGEIPAAARAHAARCPRCYRAALALDPTLVFRRLPSLAASADDVRAMKQAVAGLRRASRLAATSRLDARVLAPPGRFRRRPALRLLALAAALLLAVLSPLTPPFDVPGPAADEPPPWLRALLDQEPLIEGAESLEVIQADYPDLDLVVIIDDGREAGRLDV
ncbi:MAG: hypothetical protein D6696_17950 [Acidobacteria bacterium]|nr:MAG: hypothetical protein D6696_17950 [Acidobacteriota bacterium]